MSSSVFECLDFEYKTPPTHTHTWNTHIWGWIKEYLRDRKEGLVHQKRAGTAPRPVQSNVDTPENINRPHTTIEAGRDYSQVDEIRTSPRSSSRQQTELVRTYQNRSKIVCFKINPPVADEVSPQKPSKILLGKSYSTINNLRFIGDGISKRNTTK